MADRPLWGQILDDEALTRGLGDPEARVLVEWLVERADSLSQGKSSDLWARAEVRRLCRRGHCDLRRLDHRWPWSDHEWK